METEIEEVLASDPKSLADLDQRLSEIIVSDELQTSQSPVPKISFTSLINDLNMKIPLMVFKPPLISLVPKRCASSTS